MNEALKKKLITALEQKIINGVRFEAVLISEMNQYNWLTPINTANYCSGYLDGRESFNDAIKKLQEMLDKRDRKIVRLENMIEYLCIQ